jgi:hypothetical protein
MVRVASQDRDELLDRTGEARDLVHELLAGAELRDLTLPGGDPREARIHRSTWWVRRPLADPPTKC